jgi:uncharacterized membrane protein
MATSVPQTNATPGKPVVDAATAQQSPQASKTSVMDRLSILGLSVALIGMLTGAARLAYLDAKFIFMLIVLTVFAILWSIFLFYAVKQDKAVEKSRA